MPALAQRARRRRLLSWYARHRRPMPWRETRDPYPIWVSEVMLQQTQVATAVPYYVRFVERFPDVRALARARPESVLAAWAGLGYYRRARLLHEAARAVVRDHGGRVPSDPLVFGARPGVGRYTAGAVLSIAFDRPLAVLDGNVARVLARWNAMHVSHRDSQGSRQLWAVADSLVPMRRAGDWNQALMELGATVCLPRAPRCGECPVAVECRGLASGNPEAFPETPVRRAVTHLRRAVAIVERGGRTLVERREGALLAGLWEPPGVELESGARAGASLTARLRALGVRARLEDTGARVRHTITHRRIEVEVWRAAAEKPGAPAPRTAGRDRVRWIRGRERGIALTALARKVMGERAAPAGGARS